MKEEEWSNDHEQDGTVRAVDWKAHPGQVLEEIDSQLRIHGLEVVRIETGGDEFMWRIQGRT